MRTQKSFKELRSVGLPILNKDRFNFDITNLKIGSFVKINKAYCVVKNIFTYKDSDSSWFELELFSILTAETIFIEYEVDDIIEIFITTDVIKMRDLPVSFDDIEEISEEEDGEFDYKGETFYYEDDYKAKFYRTPESKKEKVYFYEFENDASTKFLTVEEWGNDSDGYEYKAYISKKLDSSSLEVISI